MQDLLTQKAVFFRTKNLLPSLVCSTVKSDINITLGYSQINSKEKTDETILYHIGSLTKLFTANLAWLAISVKKLSLSTELSSLFPSLENHSAGKITVLSLLTHTSGLGKNIYLEGHQRIDTLEKILSSLKSIPVNFFLNKRLEKDSYKIADTVENSDDIALCDYCYSNAGFAILRYVLEQVFQESYSEMLEKYILGPLEMNSTSLSIQDKVENAKLLATGYKNAETESNSKVLVHRVKNEDYDLKYGGGSLRTNLVDFKRYLSAYFIQARDENIFSPCIRTYITINSKKEGKEPRKLGLAWEFHKNLWTKNGAVSGFSAMVALKLNSDASFSFTNISRCKNLGSFTRNLLKQEHAQVE